MNFLRLNDLGRCFLALSLATGLSHEATANCYATPEFSEEDDGGASCVSGFVVKGVSCRGSYCDNKILLCCSYTEYSKDTLHSDDQTQYNYSKWFSEEQGRRVNTSRFVAGIECSGKYCDKLRIEFVRTPRLRNSGDCYRTDFFSEEDSEEGDNYRECKLDYFVSGVWCQDDYCDNIALTCCYSHDAEDGIREGFDPQGPYGGKADTARETSWPGFRLQE